MYALGFNITKKTCVANGQTDEEGKKFAKFDEIVSKVGNDTFFLSLGLLRKKKQEKPKSRIHIRLIIFLLD